MPAYKCEKCGCMENTAITHYWTNKYEGKPLLCSECETGKWHGRFPKQSAKGMMLGNDGFLYDPKEVKEGGQFWWNIQNGRLKIVKKIKS